MEEALIADRVNGFVGDLPALPSVVAEVLRMTEDPGTSTAEVSEIIQSDPAMTAKVLRVSNSSYYGMKQYVGTLKLALVILGVREVRNIVLGISVFETVSDRSTDMKVAQDIWHGSLRTAGICKKMSEAMKLGLQGEEFIAGLLADIGIMGLLRSEDSTYRALYDSLGEDRLALRKAEQLHFGFTHAAVSKAMAERWNLPQTLSDALGMQYAGGKFTLTNAKDPKLAALVRVARTIDHNQEGDAQLTRALEETEAWTILAESKHPIPECERSPLIMEYIEELNAVAAIPL